MSVRCIIAGGRELEDPGLVAAAIAACPFSGEISVVLSGDSRGIDRLGASWGRERGLPVLVYPADWRRGKSAGPRRNAEMAANADALIAIPGAGPGTRDMIARAKQYGLHVFVYDRHLNREASSTERDVMLISEGMER